MSNNSENSIKYQESNFPFATGTGQAKTLQICYDAGYLQCQHEFLERYRFISVEEYLPKYTGKPFYIIVVNKRNEPNIVYIEEHSDIEDIRGHFTHWRSFL